MKRLLLIIIAFVCTTTAAMAWGRLGHSTVAYIAEQHLTPKAQKALKEYLHGNSLVSVSSLNDNLKSVMLVDMGSEFPVSGDPRVNTLPHTFEAKAGTFEPTRVVNDNGRYVKNCLYFIDEYSRNLKANAKNMDDSTRFAQIISLVHFLGDMHCPEHIRYLGDDMTIGYYKVIWNGSEIRYHTLWDDAIISDKRNWSFSDIAYLMDYGTTRKMIKEYTAGDVWDWGKDCAASSFCTHGVKPGEKLEKYYTLKYQRLAQTQIVKAGYRLAKVLNETFK